MSTAQNIFIPELFDCAACGDPTHGHITGDESSTLCRECFLTWIALAQGATLEERIVSVTWSDDLEDAEEIAERMRRTLAEHKADEAKHWLSMLAGLVASFEQAFEAQTYGGALASAARVAAINECAEVASRYVRDNDDALYWREGGSSCADKLQGARDEAQRIADSIRYLLVARVEVDE